MSDAPDITLAPPRARAAVPLPKRRPSEIRPSAPAPAPRVAEAELVEAAARGDARQAASLLAQAADVPPSVIAQVERQRHVKALVSLVWSAGFSMRLAAALQVLLCRVSPGGVLAGALDGFPFTVTEMRWQLTLVSRHAAER